MALSLMRGFRASVAQIERLLLFEKFLLACFYFDCVGNQLT